MISPDINDLMRNMDSRYTLVVTVAKRARQLTAGAEPLTRFRSDKPVTLAIHEIAEGKIDYYRATAKQPEYENVRKKMSGAVHTFDLYSDLDDYNAKDEILSGAPRRGQQPTRPSYPEHDYDSDAADGDEYEEYETEGRDPEEFDDSTRDD